MVSKRFSDGIEYLSRDYPNLPRTLSGDGKESKLREDGDTRISSEISKEEFQVSLDKFLTHIKLTLTTDAIKKGYAEGNALEANGRRLYDFIQDYAGDGHALGEIIYKVTRFRRKHDPVDMIKTAAWAFLVWDKNQRG